MSLLSIHRICVAFLALAAAAASAQTYPSKGIRMIVPYPPGGGADITARPIAQVLSQRWGQPVVIENHGGASGMIGADILAKAPPDGYTIMVSASAEVALNVALFSKMPYDPVRDFAPITLATVTPMALVVHPSVPATSVNEYLAIARAKPGAMTYGSPGAGSPHHFAGEWLKMLTTTDIGHVPYKGMAPALNDMLGGHSPSGFATLLPALVHVKAGKLRVLAVTTQSRVPQLPDVPTLAETLPGFNVTQWNAVWAPAGTPKEVLEKLSNEITRIVQSVEYKTRMAEQGAEAIGGSSAELAAFQKAEIDKYRKIAQQANIKSDQ
jgi:tripartite-type tricarboxylate transporter receptor subunit TctC